MVYSAQPPRITRLAAPALLALLAGCGDAATDGSWPGGARLAVVPEYPEGFAPGSLPLMLDQVKVRVIRPPAEWIVDTAVVFPASAKSLTMRVQVPLKTRQERLEAVLELWAGAQLIFAGHRMVDVAEGAGTGQPASIPLTYLGPGADARAITIAPRDTVLRPGQSFGFGVLADDGNGVPVGDVYVNWSTSGNSGASVTPAGVLTAAEARGAVMLHARAATGARDSSRIWFAPPPTTLTLISGSNQVAVVGSTLAAPLVARVTADDGLGVPGVLVHFTTPGGGTATPTAVRTDADGVARATVTLGTKAGPQPFQGTTLGVGAVQFQLEGLVDLPSQIGIVRGNLQETPPGQLVPVPLEVVVRDQFGNLVPGAKVRWTVVAGAGHLGLTETLTNANGRALAAYQMGPEPITNLVRATLEATNTSVVFVLGQ